jgi:hypothetical protein
MEMLKPVWESVKEFSKRLSSRRGLPKPLNEMTSENIADFIVASIGAKYSRYKTNIIALKIDGLYIKNMNKPNKLDTNIDILCDKLGVEDEDKPKFIKHLYEILGVQRVLPLPMNDTTYQETSQIAEQHYVILDGRKVSIGPNGANPVSLDNLLFSCK